MRSENKPKKSKLAGMSDAKVLERVIKRLTAKKGGSKKSQLVDIASLVPPARSRVISEMLWQAHELRDHIQEQEQELKDLKNELAATQVELELEGLRSGNLVSMANMQEGRQTLSRDKLLENGVHPDVIAASYVQGDPFLVVRLDTIGEKEEGK